MSNSVAPRTVAHQAPLSMGLYRQEYWSGLPFPPPEDLPNQGSNLCLLHLLHWQVDSLTLSHRVSPWVCFLLLKYFLGTLIKVILRVLGEISLLLWIFCFFQCLVVYLGFPLCFCRLSLSVYLSLTLHSSKDEMALRLQGSVCWVHLASLWWQPALRVELLSIRVKTTWLGGFQSHTGCSVLTRRCVSFFREPCPLFKF